MQPTAVPKQAAEEFMSTTATHNHAMHVPSESLHIYSRHLTPDEHSSLRTLADLITPNSTVLDLGCGTGALGSWLNTHKLCTSDGLTLSQAEAEQARPHYRTVVVGNLETDDIRTHFGHSTYDFIVCADVLEHLTDPARTLAACHQLLAPDGRLLVSVPNVAYAGLVAELMAGKFGYRDEGLLDRTHLRFFTRSTLLTFLADNKWQPNGIYPIHRGILDSEFKVSFEAMPPAVSRYVSSSPDADTYQFVVSCKPSAEVYPTPENLGVSAPTQLLPEFTCELFLRDADSYNQQNKVTSRGVIGKTRQAVSFAVPPHPNGWTALRIDPADRPGILQLHRLCWLDTNSQVLWEWRHNASESDTLKLKHTSHHEIFWELQSDTLAGQTMVLLGEDPWFEVPIPTNLLQTASLGFTRLEIEFGWPMSADHLVLGRNLGQLKLENEVLQSRLKAHRAASDMNIASLNQKISTLDTTVQAQLKQAEVSTQLITETTLEQQRLVTENSLLRKQLSQLQGHLHWIENSTVFKVTRPLVRIKMALNNLLLPKVKPITSTSTQPLSSHVDVIVPVFKGLADTQRCILSALQSPCATPFRLIVLNDASPEPAVTQWLREIAETDERIILLENAENLGFVATVNRGMSHGTTHDVVLLNSDTEVANNWLDRLRKAAYSDTHVGTVTPLSNNATICSYPRFCHANPLADGHTTASLDNLCAATNPSVAVDVPTGVGFCMYIRRDCLNTVGLFDVANFGKGYGEENDFCRRAHASGWRNLHALDTFVLHAGGVSFGDSKSARELAAMETLRRLYPDYEAEVMRFIQADPAQPYRHALDLARLANDPRTKVLAVTHDRAGGTLRHVKELADTLQAQARFLMVTPTPGGNVTLEWLGASEGLKLEFNVDSEFDDLVHVLQAVQVRLVHYHHLLGHHPRIETLPERLGVPFDFTAHDHYSYCPQISLTDASNRYCGEAGTTQCSACLKQSPAPGGVNIVTWRGNHQRFLQHARHILAPSQDTATRMQRFMPGSHVQHAPHTDLPDSLPIPHLAPGRKPDGALKVVVIGALSAIKGADTLEAVATLAHRNQAAVEFHLIGYAYRSLKTRPRSNLTVHGEYPEAELASMLDWLQPDVVWFPALWPETYSYTLSACLQAGLPIVAPDLGAFPERLAGRAWTWIQPWNTSAADWMQFFAHIQTQHFVTGVPPSPAGLPPAIADRATSTSTWDYSKHYLPNATSADPAPPSIPAIAWLHAHRTGKAKPGFQAVATSARGHALSVLLRLRSAPGLRSMAQAIPLRWQTRVKSWLVR